MYLISYKSLFRGVLCIYCNSLFPYSFTPGAQRISKSVKEGEYRDSEETKKKRFTILQGLHDDVEKFKNVMTVDERKGD